MKSYPLLEEVVEALGFEVSFHSEGEIVRRKRGRPPLMGGNPKPSKTPKTKLPHCFKSFQAPMETDE